MSEGPLDDLLRDGTQMILSLWHQDVVPFFHYMAATSCLEHRNKFAMLASQSYDGELTERVVGPWGFRFLRGSRGKKGARAALRGLRRALKDGERIIVVADGPEPPAQYFQPGPVFLARTTGVPLYVVRTWGRPQWILRRTRYRMVIPRPRSVLGVFSSGPIDVSGDFEGARARAEAALAQLCVRAEEKLYGNKPARGIRIADRTRHIETRVRLL